VYFGCEARDEDGNVKTQKVGKVDQILFLNGHITQNHEPRNVGRGLVTESYSYTLGNVDPKMISGFGDKIKENQLQEVYHQSEVPVDNKRYYPTPDGFSDFHVSRSTLTPVDMSDYSAVMKLANAIARFPRLKPMYGKKADDYIAKP
ncbi:MAG: hypothetical protein N2C14_10015, partial [Planctomycetales bacterium]